MGEYDASTYGEHIAEVYDDWYVGLELDVVVERLAELAGPGPVLELGIGTGRVALPLQERGIEVHGIDASPAMVARLRAKPGGDRLAVTIADFADVGVVGEFSLIFIMFNTIFALTSQQDQLRCFGNAAAKLAQGGTFVFDAFVPDLGRFDRGQRLALEAIESDGLRVEASRHDPVHQRVVTRHVLVSEQGIRFYPLVTRYAWPSELDLMERLAGLRLRERWGGWRREPFTAASTSHVSVYERAAD